MKRCTTCDGLGTDPQDYDDGKGPNYWNCAPCYGSGQAIQRPWWMRPEDDDNYSGPDNWRDDE